LAYSNELVRNGRPFHAFHTRLYAFARLIPVHRLGNLEVAANKFGLLRGVWPDAVFLSRRIAMEFSAPFAQKGGMEEYLKELIEVSKRWNTP